MEFVAVFNELLFSVLAWVNWGFEIANFRCLACRTKRVQRCIHIIGLFPYRIIVDSMGKLDRIPARERCSPRSPRFFACCKSWHFCAMVTPPAGEPGLSLGVESMISGSGLLSKYVVGNHIILWNRALSFVRMFLYSPFLLHTMVICHE